MKDSGLFTNMTLMSWAAIVFFILAKVFGMIGVCLGFMGPEYHTMGGVIL
jgi:fatty-acid desaturase